MARKLRSLTVDPALPLHVIVRGNSQRRLFSYATCYRSWLLYLADGLARTGCRVHALALMTNHVHMVMSTPDTPSLSRCVKHVAQRYAVRRNRIVGTSGKLYEERFTAVSIESEAHLALTLAYVDSNPVRAGIVSVPEQHRWSTYRLHAGAPDPEPLVAQVWTPHDWYEGLAADPHRRCQRYRQWVESRRDEDIEHVAATSSDRDDESLARPRVKRPDDTRVR